MNTAEWIGPVGDVWAAEWRRTDQSFAALAPTIDAAILAAAPAGAGTAVDLGCGAGTTALAFAAARPDVDVTGVDVSPELIRVATGRGAAHAKLQFRLADLATDASAAAGADLLFSRHGVMFFDDPVPVFAALRAAAAPGARLVFSCFRSGAENPWAGALATTVAAAPLPPPAPDAPGPFAFADPARVRGLLTRAGWSVAEPHAVDFTYVAGSGDDPVADAAAFFRRIGPVAAALRGLPDADRPAALDRLHEALSLRRAGETVSFPAAAWIWSAHA